MVIQSTNDSEKDQPASFSQQAGQSASNTKDTDVKPNNNNSQSAVSAYEQYALGQPPSSKVPEKTAEAACMAEGDKVKVDSLPGV